MQPHFHWMKNSQRLLQFSVNDTLFGTAQKLHLFEVLVVISGVKSEGQRTEIENNSTKKKKNCQNLFYQLSDFLGSFLELSEWILMVSIVVNYNKML